MKCRRRFISASGVMKMSKKEKSPEKKKNRKKKVLKVLGCILALILAFVIVTTCISLVGIKSNTNKAQSFPEVGCNLKYENAGNGVWNIYSDKELKVLQLTDVHIGAGWMSIRKDSMALNAVAAMISAEKPDLVVVTGDIAYPVPFQAGTFNNKTSAKMFATLMEKLGVYWTFAFGNHDTEAYSYFSRKQISEFYSSGKYPHCIFEPGPDDVDGYCNQIFNIINSADQIDYFIIFFIIHQSIAGKIAALHIFCRCNIRSEHKLKIGVFVTGFDFLTSKRIFVMSLRMQKYRKIFADTDKAFGFHFLRSGTEYHIIGIMRWFTQNHIADGAAD